MGRWGNRKEVEKGKEKVNCCRSLGLVYFCGSGNLGKCGDDEKMKG
jgi:hypothetical protein